MISSLFQFYFSDIRSTGAAEEIDGKKKNLKKIYVRHCRLQVTCTVLIFLLPNFYCVTIFLLYVPTWYLLCFSFTSRIYDQLELRKRLMKKKNFWKNSMWDIVGYRWRALYYFFGSGIALARVLSSTGICCSLCVLREKFIVSNNGVYTV